MKLDAAWHEWSSVALAVMIDGMLAVSAQCGCCHHFHSSYSMPFHVFSPFGVILYPFWCFFILLWSVACFIVCFLVLSSLCHLYFTYNITWFNVWLFLFLVLHGVCVVGIMGYLLVGGLILLFMYHHLCLYFL